MSEPIEMYDDDGNLVATNTFTDAEGRWFLAGQEVSEWEKGFILSLRERALDGKVTVVDLRQAVVLPLEPCEHPDCVNGMYPTVDGEGMEPHSVCGGSAVKLNDDFLWRLGSAFVAVSIKDDEPFRPQVVEAARRAVLEAIGGST